MTIYPICDSLLKRSALRSIAQLQKSRQNHRSYVSTEVLSGLVFVPAEKLCIRYRVNIA